MSVNYKNRGLSSGIFNMFSRLGGDSIVVFREDCDAGWDRETGKRIYSNKIELNSCAIVESRYDRSIVQDSGAERAKGRLSIQTSKDFPLYTSDERDNAGADIVYTRGSFWKVMKTKNEGHYWESEVELMPQNECKNLGIDINVEGC